MTTVTKVTLCSITIAITIRVIVTTDTICIAIVILAPVASVFGLYRMSIPNRDLVCKYHYDYYAQVMDGLYLQNSTN